MPKDNGQTSTVVVKPDLKKMKSIFLRDLMPSGEKAAKIRGDQSAAWKMIEADCHCNKRAAKQLLKLMGESEETRDDFMRTFLPGLAELGLFPAEDLADLMGDAGAPDLGVVKAAKGAPAEGAALQ